MVIDVFMVDCCFIFCMYYGDIFDDFYEWFRVKDLDEVIVYFEVENVYIDVEIVYFVDFREWLFQEIRGCVQEIDLFVLICCGDWWYYSCIEEGV